MSNDTQLRLGPLQAYGDEEVNYSHYHEVLGPDEVRGCVVAKRNDRDVWAWGHIGGEPGQRYLQPGDVFDSAEEALDNLAKSLGPDRSPNT
jgi:hypothetical protein